MWYSFWNWFTKITAYIPQRLVFNTKYYYEDKTVQNRFIKGPAIIISNHTQLFDFATLLFAFPTRTLRAQMAELLFEKPVLGTFLKMLGGIYVNRDAHDMSALNKSEKILRDGGVVEIFPEGRLPREGEERPLPFRTGAAYLSLMTGAPIIPVHTNGKYFTVERARVVIGKPIYSADLFDKDLTEAENLKNISSILRDKVIELEKYEKG